MWENVAQTYGQKKPHKHKELLVGKRPMEGATDVDE